MAGWFQPFVNAYARSANNTFYFVKYCPLNNFLLYFKKGALNPEYVDGEPRFFFHSTKEEKFTGSGGKIPKSFPVDAVVFN